MCLEQTCNFVLKPMVSFAHMYLKLACSIIPYSDLQAILEVTILTALENVCVNNWTRPKCSKRNHLTFQPDGGDNFFDVSILTATTPPDLDQASFWCVVKLVDQLPAVWLGIFLKTNFLCWEILLFFIKMHIQQHCCGSA